jgi:hypothetical protein
VAVKQLINTKIMIRITCLITPFVFCLAFASCNRNKQKPVSNDISKTSVRLNGRKDSVLNNPEKNYGNATVAEPCVKCLIQVIQGSDQYKASVATVPVKNITYIINWVQASPPADTVNKQGVTNGIKIDVTEKGDPNKLISTFTYDNKRFKLYYEHGSQKMARIPLDIDIPLLKAIRDRCYWGVGSSK